jgi:hypothetical protein
MASIAYKHYDLVNRKIVTSRDVIFDENPNMCKHLNGKVKFCRLIKKSPVTSQTCTHRYSSH